MNILFLDLELNINKDEGNTPTSHTTDIIQIGAVILDTSTGLIVDKFNRYCSLRTPLDNGELRLSEFIVKLTGITTELLTNQGVSLIDAYNDLIKFCETHKASRMAGTWGSGDLQEIRDQVNYICDVSDVPYVEGTEYDASKYNKVHFRAPWEDVTKTYITMVKPKWWFSKYTNTGFFDVKKMYQSYCIANSMSAQSGLRKSMNKLKLTLDKQMSFHDAVSDAYGTALIYYFLLQKFKQ